MIIMRHSFTHPAALVALVCLFTAADAHRTSELSMKPAASVPAVGEEAAASVDPAVLDRCRQQADAQKLKEGPERKAFMGTCVTPED